MRIERALPLTHAFGCLTLSLLLFKFLTVVLLLLLTLITVFTPFNVRFLYEEALARTKPEHWPIFGGWELLLSPEDFQHARTIGMDFDKDVMVAPEVDEGGGDSSGLWG